MNLSLTRYEWAVDPIDSEWEATTSLNVREQDGWEFVCAISPANRSALNYYRRPLPLPQPRKTNVLESVEVPA